MKGDQPMKKPQRIAALAVIILAGLMPALADAQANFYEGKTITLIQSSEGGGTGDLRVKAVIPFLRKYIAGSPQILSEYMPGGGGRKAGNYMFASARPDGLTVGHVGGVVANAIQGQAGVQYDVDKFVYLAHGTQRPAHCDRLLGNRAGPESASGRDRLTRQHRRYRAATRRRFTD